MASRKSDSGVSFGEKSIDPFFRDRCQLVQRNERRMPSVEFSGFVERRWSDDVLVPDANVDSRFVAIPFDIGPSDDFDIGLGKKQVPAARPACGHSDRVKLSELFGDSCEVCAAVFAVLVVQVDDETIFTGESDVRGWPFGPPIPDLVEIEARTLDAAIDERGFSFFPVLARIVPWIAAGKDVVPQFGDPLSFKG